MSRVQVYNWRNQDWVLVPETYHGWVGHSFSDIRSAYRQNPCLRELAELFGIGTVLMRRVLDLVRIDYVSHWHLQHLKGTSCEKIAEDQRVAVSTLRCLFKSRKLSVFRGCARKRVSQADLSKAAKETKSINEAAQSLGVSWATARQLLDDYGFIRHTNFGYELFAPPAPAKGWCTRLRI